ncbi:MAG TPA: DUF4337 domain-containing protein [Janthinobacterium sp.]|nr:DUF4337 domain-containing protein [Janthinobacterium sp.]
MEALDMVDGPETPRPASRLNMAVAVTVALLATFMGICKVKDDNLNQAMQQSQANKVDHWSFYQARNVREEIAKSTIVQLTVATGARADQGAARDAIQKYEAMAAEQAKKKQEARALAEQDQKDYDAANFRDDQFDLSDTLLAIAIAMLAVTALTQQVWLYAAALLPTAFGIVMGLAGLAGWRIHPNALIALLS